MNLPFDGDPVTPVQPLRIRKSCNSLKYVLAGVFGGIGVIVIIFEILFLVRKTCNKGSVSQSSANVEPVQEDPNVNGQNVSVDILTWADSFRYEQMLKATTGFSDMNLIKHGHNGDIFSRKLEDGSDVVIKRVNMRSSRKDCYSKGMHTSSFPWNND